MKIEIVNDGGVYMINGKRLGHDILSEAEISAINEFIKEYKQSNK
jgi:hypothetical protein